ncbi:MAG: permease [Pseudomonadota bacterium]
MAVQTPPEPRRRMAVVDKTTLFYVLLALVSAALVLIIKSPAAMTDAVSGALLLFLAIAPMIVMGLFLGGLVKAIADPAKVAPILGQQSGLRGLALASVLGALTPGGPFAAFPIVYAIFAAGADVGAIVAFLTGWSLIALHRVVVWELPLMGPDVVGLRILISLPLPVLAGLQARWLVRNVDLFRSVGPRDLSADEPRG